MRRFTRLFVLVAAVLIFLPQHGLAKYVDPYQNTTINGGARFIYTHGKTTITQKNSPTPNDTQDNYNGFRQIYNLGMRGKLLSRRLIIYDVGVEHTKDSVRSVYTSSASGEKNTSLRKNNITNYHFQTTIVPKSAIPLMVRGSSIKESDKGTYVASRTTSTFGVEWSLLVKTLPEVHASYDSAKTTDSTGSRSTQQYHADAMKEIGITNNVFTITKSSNKLPSNNDTSVTNIGFTNTTHFSSKTDMSANLAKNTSTNNRSGNFSGSSANMSLNSRPGSDFTQRHSYMYRQSKGTGMSESSLYSGNMSYRLTDRLSTTMGIGSRSDVSRHDNQQLRRSGLDMSDVIRYRLTRRLVWRVDGVYAHERSDAPNANARGLNWTRYKLTTGLDYKRIFKRFTLGLSGQGGYVVENTGAKTSTTYKRRRGLTYGGSISLSRINLWNYVMLNASYAVTQAKDQLRDNMSDTRIYSAGVYNIVARKYMSAQVRYTKRVDDSWYAAGVKRQESLDGRIGTNPRYFKDSMVNLTVRRVKSYTLVAGNVLTDNLKLVGRTKRNSSLGETTSEVNIIRAKSNAQEIHSLTTSSLDTLRIEQRLLVFNTTKLGLDIKRFKNSTNNVVTEVNNETTVNINYFRPLRAGQAMANYSYRMVKNRYMSESEDHRTHLFKAKIKKEIGDVNLALGYSFNSTSGTYRRLVEKYTVHTGEAVFNKRFSRNLSLELFGLMSKASGTFAYMEVPSVTEYSATLLYVLRRWTVGASYSNKVSDYKQQTITDNRIMLSLSREVFRMW